MFSLPECYIHEKRELLQNFDQRLKTNPDSISKYDLEVLQNKISNMNKSIQNYSVGGLVTSGVVLWNLKGVQGLSPVFKAFAVIAPPLLCPLYCYLSSIQKIQGFEAFLALKYKDLESAKKPNPPQ